MKKIFDNSSTNIIFLEKQKEDYCYYLNKILLIEGLDIYIKLKVKLDCKLEINCKIFS